MHRLNTPTIPSTFIIAIFTIPTVWRRLSTTITRWSAITKHIMTIIVIFTTIIMLCFINIVNVVTTIVIIALRGFMMINTIVWVLIVFLYTTLTSFLIGVVLLFLPTRTSKAFLTTNLAWKLFSFFLIQTILQKLFLWCTRCFHTEVPPSTIVC